MFNTQGQIDIFLLCRAAVDISEAELEKHLTPHDSTKITNISSLTSSCINFTSNLDVFQLHRSGGELGFICDAKSIKTCHLKNECLDT